MSAEAASLKALFGQRDRVAAQLAEVDRRIDAATETYRRSKGYMIRPRVEILRREVGA